MKKKLLTTLLLSIVVTVSVNAQNPVPNASFENWLGGAPVSWTANNLPPSFVPITQVSPGHSGISAAKGEFILSPILSLPPILSSTNTSGAGFPVTQLYSTLSFYYKFNQWGAAQFDVTAGIYDAGNSLISVAAENINTPASSFTYMSIPFFNFGVGAPATARIIFTLDDSLGANLIPGTFFIVDDVSFSGTTSINFNENALQISKVQPNPAADKVWVYYNLDKTCNIAFRIYDVTGKMFNETFINNENSGKHKTELDVTHVPAGFYFLKIETPDGFAAYPLQVIR